MSLLFILSSAEFANSVALIISLLYFPLAISTGG